MSRELDAAIAKALGYEVKCWDELPEKSIYSGLDKDYWTHDGDRRWHKVPAYSTDGNAMLELIAEMHVRKWCFGIIIFDGDDVVRASFNCRKRHEYKGGRFFEYGDGESKSIPMAVALAAHHALTGKEYEEENKGEKVSE